MTCIYYILPYAIRRCLSFFLCSLLFFVLFSCLLLLLFSLLSSRSFPPLFFLCIFCKLLNFLYNFIFLCFHTSHSISFNMCIVLLRIISISFFPVLCFFRLFLH